MRLHEHEIQVIILRDKLTSVLASRLCPQAAQAKYVTYAVAAYFNYMCAVPQQSCVSSLAHQKQASKEQQHPTCTNAWHGMLLSSQVLEARGAREDLAGRVLLDHDTSTTPCSLEA